MTKIPVEPTSRKAIWDEVRSIRRALGVENKLYFDVINFLELIMPKIFPNFVYEICSIAEMGNLHGKTIPSEVKICIREDVYTGACEGKGRDRLTIAHEIGHLFLHNEHSVSFCRLKPNGEIPNYCDADWQADVFAGELLAPSYLIKNMTVKDIHNACAVSLDCASRQLYAIDCQRQKGYKQI